MTFDAQHEHSSKQVSKQATHSICICISNLHTDKTDQGTDRRFHLTAKQKVQRALCFARAVLQILVTKPPSTINMSVSRWAFPLVSRTPSPPPPPPKPTISRFTHRHHPGISQVSSNSRVASLKKKKHGSRPPSSFSSCSPSHPRASQRSVRRNAKGARFLLFSARFPALLVVCVFAVS